ncbi:hypothetical protein MUP59_02685 [Candidatus Bathyarchaeota archaeon]|nr:hypothetical protein [Candidatus Bathyarchaeota archaeon]
MVRIQEAVDDISKNVNNEDWKDVSEGVSKIGEMLNGLEKKWKYREKMFRSGEI